MRLAKYAVSQESKVERRVSAGCGVEGSRCKRDPQTCLQIGDVGERPEGPGGIWGKNCPRRRGQHIRGPAIGCDAQGTGWCQWPGAEGAARGGNETRVVKKMERS